MRKSAEDREIVQITIKRAKDTEMINEIDNRKGFET